MQMVLKNKASVLLCKSYLDESYFSLRDIADRKHYRSWMALHELGDTPDKKPTVHLPAIIFSTHEQVVRDRSIPTLFGEEFNVDGEVLTSAGAGK